MTKALTGKVALITGAASGIGRATALLFASQGARVAVADLDDSAGAEVVAQITSGGGQASFLHLDVSSESEWSSAAYNLLATCNRLDIVVNAAGISLSKPILDVSLAEWQKLMAVNLQGVFLGTREAVRAMRMNQNGGAIVNVGSVAGLVGRGGAPAYSASKGGVRLLTKSVALQCARSGWNIRVNCVNPGFVETALMTALIARASDPQKQRRDFEDEHPMGRMAAPFEIANAIFYLACDLSSFMTGSDLVVDGGLTAQ